MSAAYAEHLVGGAGTSVSLSSGTEVDLMWPLVFVRYEAAVCFSSTVRHKFDSPRQGIVVEFLTTACIYMRANGRSYTTYTCFVYCNRLTLLVGRVSG